MSNNKMLIDASHPEETRVAMVRGNRVDEFDFESEHKHQIRGNIYLAKVTRVEPSLQAAFVDYGGNRHGFLAFSEIHPDYYQIPVADRQALLDAEAEDARREEEAHAADEIDSNDGDDEDDEQEEKPARKRRSRRRGGRNKKAAADDSADDADENSDDDAANAGDFEENDESPDEMAADNDGDDVVSEPAKPKRRTTRRKKAEPVEAETEAEAETEEEAPAKPKKRAARKKKVAEEAKVEEAASSDAEAEEKPKRRRTSRPKKAVKAEETAEEAVTEAATDESVEEKPKRRRTSRKKKDEAETSAEEQPLEEVAAADAVADDVQSDDEEKPKRRRTSRKKKAKSEADETVEAEESADSDESKDEADASSPDDEDAPRERKTRSRRRGRGRGKKNVEAEGDDEDVAVEAVGAEDAMEEVPVRRTNRRHYKIQEVIKRRQILLVQVVKEERGNKGAALTTYLSLAGRYSVLMPNTARGGGISRKITNSGDRKRLKAIAADLDVPQGMGVILRTAGASRDSSEVQRDFEYLMRLWENVRTLTLESTAPSLVYEEGSLIKRSIRDLFDKDTSEILVSGEAGHKEAKDFMSMLMPEQAKNVKLYKDHVPLFAKMGVEAQLDAMLQPQVTLKSGGYLIINQTEALVAIDVNSGRSTRQHSIEETATATNLEAADEVARQLRLRDLAGLVVIDFIDMEERRNNRNVEKRLKDALKHDRARIQVGRISHFGLMEMSRQRIRASVLESTTQVCPTCEGLGHVRAASSVVLGVLRSIEEQLNKNSRNDLDVRVNGQTALYLLNSKRENLSDLERQFGVTINIDIDDSIGLEPCVIERGEPARRKPAQETAVTPDSFAPEEKSADSSDDSSAPQAKAETNSDDDNNGEGKKRRRRRRRRKGGSDDTAENSNEGSTQFDEDTAAVAETQASEETSAPAPTPEDDERPKRRRTSRKKSDDGEDASTETAESTSEEKPVKRTRRKKKSDDEATAEVPAAEQPSDETEADLRPKRRTTRRKKAEEAGSEASVETDDTSEKSEEEAPKKDGWFKRKFF